ncbi:MAG: molybdopterin molybdotransferase MoeA [Thaumarchaeota archaeon]|jgi:molybdopterin molybdotransferase|nr:molybdopterin molybdotransferase MoeA [Candidatus Wolframiiraptor allenii]
MRERLRGFSKLTSIEDAQEMLRNKVTYRIIDVEEVELGAATGRICGEDIRAPMDSPAYDRSAVDGYAVVAEDTFGASPTNPVELKLVCRIELGAAPSCLPEIRRGEAAEVPTGGPIPRGANAVVPFEHAKRINGRLEVYEQVRPLQNISRRGEDYRSGEIVLRRGWLIKPWHVAALASLGFRSLRVIRRPRVAILSSGGELVEPGERLAPGRVYNCTKPMIWAMLTFYGAEPIDLGTVPDDVDLIYERISEGLKVSDAVIVTGGTSVGERDLVPEAISRIGEIAVHGLAIRPGKPMGFATASGKPVFMLSGFPVAALIGFQELVIPALEHMLGCKFDPPPRVSGRLTRKVASPPGIRTYVRVRVFRSADGEVLIEPLRVTGSGILSTLTRGNGLLIIPEELEGLDEGSKVEVILLSPIFEGDEA